MEIIRLSEASVSVTAARAVEVIRNGGVVLYPTDTLYGLGADALSDEAVAAIYDIKGRDERKPLHAIMTDLDMAGEYADVTNDARLLVKEFGGKVTLILKKKEGIDTGVARGIASFGIRIPDHDFCIAMCRAFGKPITATSANRADMVPERSVETILAQLGHWARGIELVIDAGELSESKPSTVVDFTQGRPLVLREGAVAADSVWEVIQ